MKKTVVSLLFLVLVLACLAVPAAVAADRSATWTLTCKKNGCGANWSWYQNGTLLSSGFASGSSGTTVQPSAANSISIEVSSGTCLARGGGSFAPGSPINFTVKVSNQNCSNPYQQANATFSIGS